MAAGRPRGRDVDLSQLEMLVAVAQEKSFSRAADRVHRTQSAVSQAVQRLEDEIGSSLFDRSSRSGTLTDAGRVLYEYALQMLNLRREARAAIQEVGSLRRGKITIAANEYTVLHLLPVLETYRARHPHIAVAIKRSLASQIPSEILSREAEIGIVTYRPEQPALTVVPVAKDEIALLVAPGHPLAGRTSVSLRELGAESFLSHNVRSPYRERVVRTFERHRTPFHISMELPTLEAVRRLVVAGLGVALMPRRAADAEIARGEIVAVGVREMRFERPVHLVYRTKGLSHAALAFVQCARELFRASEEGPAHGPRAAQRG
jgi:DNA-binding transcriptional LysR family regulator